jgi:hypothetical protein
MSRPSLIRQADAPPWYALMPRTYKRDLREAVIGYRLSVVGTPTDN